jgi:hypothetical protein
MVSTIERFFLRAKAHEIFLVVVGTYFLGQIAIFSSITENPVGRSPASIDLRMGLIGGICSSVVFVWLGFLGTSLNALSDANLRRRVGFFASTLLFSGGYLILLFVSSKNPRVLNVIGPIAVIVTIFLFLALRFTARALVAAETRKAPAFSDYAGPFFLLWFFPIGIWIVQPRVNRVYAERGEPDFR